MDQPQIMNNVRVFLHVAGTIATTLGWLAPEKFEVITALVLSFVGPVTNAVAFVMSWRANSKTGILKSAVSLPTADVAQAVVQMPLIKGIVTTPVVAALASSPLVVASAAQLQGR